MSLIGNMILGRRLTIQQKSCANAVSASLFILGKDVAGIFTTLLAFNQNAFLYQVVDVAECSRLGSLANLGPFRCCEFPIKTIPKPVDHLDLTSIHCDIAVLLPEHGLLQNTPNNRLSALHRIP